MDTIFLLTVYLTVVNLVAFAVMGLDKWKSKRRAWRVPEATLFILAVVGGSIGAIIGMYSFRHKTKHASFVFGMPAILILQIICVLALIFSPLRVIFM